MPRYLTFVICLSLYSSFLFPALAIATVTTETVSDDVDLVVNKFPASGDRLVIWIAPGFGFKDSHTQLAELLSKNGIEVWLTDLLQSQFLPKGTASIKSLNGDLVSDLVSTAYTQSKKTITLMSGTYGAVPVLRGIRHWQLKPQSNEKLLGAILFSPSLYQSIPPLGAEPSYLPIARASNTPIFIFQGATHGNRWQLDKLISELQSGGSQVYTQVIPKIGSVFFSPEDPLVKREFLQMPKRIKNALALLAATGMPKTAVPMNTKTTQIGSGLDSDLKPYKGNISPAPLQLRSINGKQYRKLDYKDQITIVNFWASWCKPCVKEIPSLNNLRRKMQGKPFELISINYAESAETITAFMKTVKVEFPVLLDPAGKEAANWRVIAFPSTFVIGPDGQIRFGVNAGIEWDTDEVILQLNRLYGL